MAIRAAGGGSLRGHWAPWRATLAAASLGGASDTIAAMVGAIGGATSGLDRPMVGALAIVEHVNGIRLAQVADALLSLRLLG